MVGCTKATSWDRAASRSYNGRRIWPPAAAWSWWSATGSGAWLPGLVVVQRHGDEFDSNIGLRDVLAACCAG